MMPFICYSHLVANSYMEDQDVTPLLNDLYQFSMAYAYWKCGKHESSSVFELFFRKNPFGGEFTIFAGLSEVLDYLERFRVTDSELETIRQLLPGADEGFFGWLSSLTTRGLRVFAITEGSVVFPREPLLRLEGPLALVQLLETTLLTLTNYPSLVATNAARHRLIASRRAELLEFGLRRAQGPNGGLSASRYAYLGGFDGTSNVLASRRFGIPCRGTHAHAFVQSFRAHDALEARVVGGIDLLARAEVLRGELGFGGANDGELRAFVGYAAAYPDGFLALVDTYDTVKSGVPNFLAVAAALREAGHRARGIRLDSGDLAFLSKTARAMFHRVAETLGAPEFAAMTIVASNDLNEGTIASLETQGHSIDVFAVGTNLVTCQAQPALGCVYKLVEIEGNPRIKISQDVAKITLPMRKVIYRLHGAGHPLLDLLVGADEPESAHPRAGERLLCRHPFDERKRAYVTPTRVERINPLVFGDGKRAAASAPTLAESRARCMAEVKGMRSDITRLLNPTPYKVSVSSALFDDTRRLYEEEAPIVELND